MQPVRSLTDRKTMCQSLVSVITPSFNQGRFIEDTIRSIGLQTYERVEHIVVDGGSTDGTLDILKRHQRSYSLHWLSEPDEGMYDAINKGLRLARGDILGYLNCDDFYLPWSIEVAVEHLADSVLIFGDLIRLDELTNTISPLFSLPFMLGYYSCFGFISQPTVFFRRQILEQIGFFDHTSFRLVADCDYWLRCALAGIRPGKVWEFLAVEREHSMMQRTAKSKQLREELTRLRSKYSACSVTRYNLYRLFNHAFWRAMLVAYKTGFPPGAWPRTRKYKMMNLGWADVANQWTSTAFKQRARHSAEQIRWTRA